MSGRLQSPIPRSRVRLVLVTVAIVGALIAVGYFLRFGRSWISEFLPVLSVFVAVAAAVLSLYASKPDRRWAAGIAAILFVVLGAQQAWEIYEQRQMVRQQQSYVYDRLLQANAQFFGLLANMLYFASDGWLPKTEDEFSSEKAVIRMCRELNVDADAPVFPTRPWWRHVGETTKNYHHTVHELQALYGASLDVDLLGMLQGIDVGPLHQFWESFPPSVRESDRQMGFNRLMPLCSGVEPEVHAELLKIRALHNRVRDEAKALGINRREDWLSFRQERDGHKLGKDRHVFRPPILGS